MVRKLKRIVCYILVASIIVHLGMLLSEDSGGCLLPQIITQNEACVKRESQNAISDITDRLTGMTGEFEDVGKPEFHDKGTVWNIKDTLMGMNRSFEDFIKSELHKDYKNTPPGTKREYEDVINSKLYTDSNSIGDKTKNARKAEKGVPELGSARQYIPSTLPTTKFMKAKEQNGTRSTKGLTYQTFFLDYNRTSVLHYHAAMRNVDMDEIVTFSEGSERQFERYLLLYPNSPHIELLKRAVIKATWDRIAKTNFVFHEPVIVGKETVISPVNTTRAMGLYVLQIQLDETISGNASRGGSAFRVISASNYHVLCGFSDLFNGTYFFFCPVYGNEATVSVQLSVIDYQGYQGMTSSYDEYIWKEAITIQDTARTTAVPWGKSQFNKKFESPHGVWTSGNRPVFHTNNGHVLVKHKSMNCNCLKRFTLFFIGASHLRNAFFCLFSACHQRYKVMYHTIFSDGFYMPDVWNTTVARWHNATTHPLFESTPQDRVFIVQTGSWDLAFKDFKNTTLTVLPEFMRNLSSLQEKGVRVIVVGTPSLPNEGEPPLKRVSRNNQITAVFNKRQRELAEQYGIEFIDMFSVTMPRYRWRPLEYGIKTHHYILNQCRGLVGLTALELLIAQLCPDLLAKHDLWTKKLNEAYDDERERWGNVTVHR